MTINSESGELRTDDFILNQPVILGRGSRVSKPTARSETFRIDIAAKNQRREKRMSQVSAQQTQVGVEPNTTYHYSTYNGGTISNYGQEGQWAPQQGGSYQPTSPWPTETRASREDALQAPLRSDHYDNEVSAGGSPMASNIDYTTGPSNMANYVPDQPVDVQDDEASFEQAANADESLFHLSTQPASMISSRRLSLPQPKTNNSTRRVHVTSPSPAVPPATHHATPHRAPLSRLSQTPPNHSVTQHRVVAHHGFVPPSPNTQDRHTLAPPPLNYHGGNQENASNSRRSPAHAETNDADDENTSDREQPPTKKKKTNRERSARDLDIEIKQVLEIAYSHFKCDVSTANPFPDVSGDIEIRIMHALERACNQTRLNPTIGRMEFGLIKDRLTQVRGQVKTLARAYLPSAFGFLSLDDCIGHSADAIERVKAQNRKIVELLKHKSAFVYQDPENRDLPNTMYKQKIITKIIVAQWFNSLQADGIRYAEYFTPFPLTTMAFVCTAIECAIDEWSTGERKQVDFNGKKYEKVYNRHMKNLNSWKKFSMSAGNDLAQQVLDELLNTARQKAGVSAHTVEVDESEELDYADFMVNQGLQG